MLLLLSGIWFSDPACADDRPDEFDLLNAGAFRGEAALFVLQQPGHYRWGYHAGLIVKAVRAADGEPLAILFDDELANKLFPDVKEWLVLGVDSLGRCYINVDEQQIAVITGGEITGTLPGAEVFRDWDIVAFDGGLVGGSRFDLQRSTLGSNPIGLAINARLERFPLPVKYMEAADPPGCWHAVNRDGSLIYVGSEWEARVWDGRGNLRFDLGTVYPNPYGWRNSIPELEPEQLLLVPHLYFSAPSGSFDTARRLWLLYRGKMWAVDEYGQELTACFELPNAQGEPLRWVEYCFGDDPLILYALFEDREVYIYDLSPTLEWELSELNDLYFPKGLPPVLVASYALAQQLESAE